MAVYSLPSLKFGHGWVITSHILCLRSEVYLIPGGKRWMHWRHHNNEGSAQDAVTPLLTHWSYCSLALSHDITSTHWNTCIFKYTSFHHHHGVTTTWKKRQKIDNTLTCYHTSTIMLNFEKCYSVSIHNAIYSFTQQDVLLLITQYNAIIHESKLCHWKKNSKLIWPVRLFDVTNRYWHWYEMLHNSYIDL